MSAPGVVPDGDALPLGRTNLHVAAEGAGPLPEPEEAPLRHWGEIGCGGRWGLGGGEQRPSGHQAAVEGEGLAGEVGGFGGADVQDGFGDFLGGAGAVQRQD